MIYVEEGTEVSVTSSWTNTDTDPDTVTFVIKYKETDEGEWVVAAGTKSGLEYTYTIAEATSKRI